MKKQLALLSAAAILLSGCTDNKESTISQNNSDQSLSETAENIIEGNPLPVIPEEKEPLKLSVPKLRKSSLYLETEAEGAAERFSQAASANAAMSHKEMGIELTSAPITDESGAITDIVYSYTIEDLTTEAFIMLRSETDVRVLIDPAYMYNIPLPTTELVPLSEYCFDINGTKVYADSVYVEPTLYKWDKTTLFREHHSNEYVYARITLDLTLNFSSAGFSATGILRDITELAEAETALKVSQLSADAFDEKSAPAAEAYRALLSAKESFLDENVVGINLIDLDFDENPEVLVSRYIETNSDMATYQYSQGFVDVDIYSIIGGELSYIDTLYNFVYQTNSEGNVIGIKTLENGEKAWFNMSRTTRELKGNIPAENPNIDQYETDYIFTLEDGEIKFSEVFRSEPIIENGEIFDYNYYLNGEKMEFEVTYGYKPFYDLDNPDDPEHKNAEKDWPYYSYGKYRASFGKWEIYGWLREEYCSDIEQKYVLYSEPLCTDKDSEKLCQPLPRTERMLDYLLANAVDAFYFGEYRPDLSRMYYLFLGGYAKPVIYLYPTEPTDVSVKLNLDGEITCAYPDYRGGWNVTAYPDGTLIDRATGREYYCLYWEGNSPAEWDMSRGEVVRGKDTAEFLERKLTELGLTARERNEFIIYWLPLMEQNEYNFITFQTDSYNAAVPLDITPAPDSLLRVFMMYAAVPEYFETTPQHFDGFERNGFTVVEWGGGEAKAE